jgi:hypothetical protein
MGVNSLAQTLSAFQVIVAEQDADTLAAPPACHNGECQ